MADVSKEQIAQLFAVHNGPERKQTLLARSYGFDTTRTWVSDDGYRLSDRVWRSRQAVRTQIDDILRQALAEGTDALEVADVLEQYLNPSLAPIRNADGKLIRNQARSVVTSAPGRGGMGSFSARRLARTEITRALGQSTIETAKRTPFAVGVRWSLSNRHPKGDECNDNAEHSSPGLPRGVYTTNDVPRYPSHPMCLCFLSTETDPDTDKVVASLRDKYGLGGDAPASDAVAPQPAPPDIRTDQPAKTTTPKSATTRPVTQLTPRQRLSRELQRTEQGIRHNTTESAHVFDANGNKLFSTQGDHDRVAFTNAQAAQMKNATLTHNHPGTKGGNGLEQGFGLSDADIKMAYRRDMQEIRAVRPDGETYVLRRPAGGWGVTDEQFEVGYNEERQAVMQDILKKKAAGEITNAHDAGVYYGPALNRRLADRFGWEFEEGRLP